MRTAILLSAIIIAGALNEKFFVDNTTSFTYIIWAAFIWDVIESIKKRKDENICNDTDDSNSKHRVR